MPLQRQGIIPTEGRPKTVAIQQRLLAYHPQTASEGIVHADTIRQFNDCLTSRQHRLQAVNSGLPPIMWYVVLVGSIIKIGLVWLLDMKLVSQLFLGGVLACFLGSVIFLTAAMDKPFRGELGLSAKPIETLHGIMMEDSH